ncbi:hypothetical protein EVAR_83677_1 [Eumeta japonica]|uniref:Uncharacterized protein n=1 Tax=Eumeta variegata TaxID=151549 RepID=A0A4C1Y220_EUMVA|nr:hypothetical protein EVAR_83677_1 [Eumeta japonica]
MASRLDSPFDLERCGPAVDLGLEKVNEMFAHHGVMLEKVQGSCVLRKNRFHRRISSVVGCRPRFVLARPGVSDGSRLGGRRQRLATVGHVISATSAV